MKNSINCDDAPLASSLAFYFSWNQKLFKTWNEIYHSDASIEKKDNISNVLFDS